MSRFQKATKEKAKARIALFGPSGAGKTFSALRIATGMGGRIAVVDTERGSASKYADRFNFDVLDMEKKTIVDYCDAIRDAGAEKYDVLVIDSLSHGWQELLEEIDQIAKAKYRGNTWSAWSEGSPKQRKLVDAILSFSGHIIATMRSKTEWTQEKDDRTGRTKPVRVGLAPEQGKGIEYEFDMLFEMSVEHFCSVIKDRSGRFQDRIIEKPSEEFGKEIAAWLTDGKEPAAPPKIEPKQHRQLEAEINKRAVDRAAFKQYLGVEHLTDILAKDFSKALAAVQTKPLKEKEPANAEQK